MIIDVGQLPLNNSGLESAEDLMEWVKLYLRYVKIRKLTKSSNSKDHRLIYHLHTCSETCGVNYAKVTVELINFTTLVTAPLDCLGVKCADVGCRY